jgi:threonine dehydratase
MPDQDSSSYPSLSRIRCAAERLAGKTLAAGKRIGLIVCGSNIDAGRYSELLERGRRS